jgi:hypothetical protein
MRFLRAIGTMVLLAGITAGVWFLAELLTEDQEEVEFGDE